MQRRDFMLSAAAGATASFLARNANAAENRNGEFKICAFVKFIQSLSFDRLAETIKQLGFDGIEATVRNGGQVLPERVEDDLPKLVEALRKHDLEISVMASNVNRADHPLTEKVLRTAASLGVRKYRMHYFRYDLSKPVAKQLDELRPVVKELAALNRELGISAVYQNHSGAQNVGASVWDLHWLLRGIPIAEIGNAFDIRHATVEGGLAWPVSFNLMQAHLGAVYVKDFQWKGRRPENVPLGEGQVDPAFFSLLKKSKFRGPISLHVEYLGKEGVAENVNALNKDLATLRKYLST
jgi:sugar phosphate isomerase/epimerase